MKQDQVFKRYYKEFGIAMTVYVITVIASVSVLTRYEFPQTIKAVIAVTPVIPTIFVIIAIMRGLRDSDELQQKVQFNAIMFSAITTGMITFGYGFLEGIGFPKFPTIWILPMMFGLWGLSLGYFWKKYQ
jgi:hypothetical protein